MSGPRISIVVPVYGCVDCLTSLCERLTATLAGFASWYEIVLVDDRSPDGSWNTILTLRDKIPHVRGVRLSRNFGQHFAITAGLAAAHGDYVVVMDCDLQDPPEDIPRLWQRMQEGHDIVLGKRTDRTHSRFRLFAAKLYFKLLNRLTKDKLEGSYGTFSMLSRKAVNGFLQFSEHNRHYLFIVRWLGFSTGEIEYTHVERASGCSAYSLPQLFRLAMDGIFFQTTALLHWIVGLGLIFACGSVFYTLVLIVRYFASEHVVAGWTSLAVLISFCTGVMLSCMGVIGLYVAKIFEQSKGRPLYIVDEDTGLAGD